MATAGLVALLWLLLALPGYALLRRFGRAWLQAGPLCTFALSSLASYVLLTPVSAAGYALGLPLWLLTGALGLAIAAAAVDIARGASWPPRLPRPSLVPALAFTVIAADAVLGLRTGAYLEGDSLYHRARVRMLLTYGFNNLDPLVRGRLEEVYQGNLHHALLAALAQATGLSATDVWAYSWFWTKLVCAGAIAYLAWVVLRDRTLAWIAAAAFAVHMASSSVLAYPNTLAVYWLIPIAAAFAVQLQTDEMRWPAAAGLAAVTLACAQMHLLYYVFIGLIAGPALLVALVRAQRSRAPQRRALLVALLALGLGLPWLGAAVLQRGALIRERPPVAAVDAPAATPVPAAPPEPVTAAEAAAAAKAATAQEREYRGFLRLPGGQLMFKPSALSNPNSPHLQLIIALVLGLLTGRRRAILALGAVALAAFAVLYVPPVCTAILALAREPWVIRRLAAVVTVFYFAVVPCAVFLLVRERVVPWLGARIASWTGADRLAWFRTRAAAAALELVLLCLALGHGWARGIDSEPWSRAQYLANALDGAALRRALQTHAERRAVFDAHIPRGATVLTLLRDAGRLVVDCDCYPLALTLAQGKHGVRDMSQRRLDAERLLNKQVDIRLRVALLRKYGIAAVWANGGRAGRLKKLYRPLASHEARLDRGSVLVLDLNRERPIPAE